jgi:hypothetical protein
MWGFAPRPTRGTYQIKLARVGTRDERPLDPQYERVERSRMVRVLARSVTEEGFRADSHACAGQLCPDKLPQPCRDCFETLAARRKGSGGLSLKAENNA